MMVARTAIPTAIGIKRFILVSYRFSWFCSQGPYPVTTNNPQPGRKVSEKLNSCARNRWNASGLVTGSVRGPRLFEKTGLLVADVHDAGTDVAALDSPLGCLRPTN